MKDRSDDPSHHGATLKLGNPRVACLDPVDVGEEGVPRQNPALLVSVNSAVSPTGRVFLRAGRLKDLYNYKDQNKTSAEC